LLTEPTIEKLKTMRLDGLVAAWAEQQQQPKVAQLSFDERLGLLVDAEWMHRENRRMNRALREAKLRLTQACVEDIEYSARRELDKAVVRQLASCRWVQEHQAVLITGMTGTGKSYLACALAHQACRKGFRAIYRRASRLFDELKLARADGSFSRVLAKLARVDVLIIDDFAVAPVTDAQRADLLEILEDRYASRATVVTSQLPPAQWHDYLADPTLADAICDRLLNNAHRIVLKGPSRRKEEKAEKKET
jgi:DNA replication protein DnaC